MLTESLRLLKREARHGTFAVTSCLRRPIMFSLAKLSSIPESLLLLILHASLALGQSQPLAINQTQSFLTAPTDNTTFALPKSNSPLYVSLSLCSAPEQDGPRFFVTNNSQISDPGSQTTGDDVFEITIDGAGFGSFSFEGAPDGGAFGVKLGTDVESLEIGVSDTGMRAVILQDDYAYNVTTRTHP